MARSPARADRIARRRVMILRDMLERLEALASALEQQSPVPTIMLARARQSIERVGRRLRTSENKLEQVRARPQRG